jgi:Ni/Co efflux regulator RcnB
MKTIMGKLLLGTVAASLMAVPASAQTWGHRDNNRIERIDRQHVNRGPAKRVVVKKVQYRNWHRGDRFDRRYARNYRVIQNPRYYGLRYAPSGYRWVQSGNDAVLIAITSGIIASVLSNAF